MRWSENQIYCFVVWVQRIQIHVRFFFSLSYFPLYSHIGEWLNETMILSRKTFTWSLPFLSSVQVINDVYERTVQCFGW